MILNFINLPPKDNLLIDKPSFQLRNNVNDDVTKNIVLKNAIIIDPSQNLDVLSGKTLRIGIF